VSFTLKVRPIVAENVMSKRLKELSEPANVVTHYQDKKGDAAMKVAILVAAVLAIAVCPVSAQPTNDSAKQNAPGQQQKEPGDAKKSAPGQRQTEPGQAKDFAPGQQQQQGKGQKGPGTTTGGGGSNTRTPK
jgi:hypothetical protein